MARERLGGVGEAFAGGAVRALTEDGVRVPDSARLPNVKGLKGPLGCLTQARFGITWGPIGAAQACLKEVLDYTAERKQRYGAV